MIVEVLKQLKSYYEDSFFSNTIKSIGKKITEAWDQSAVGKCFSNDESDEKMQQSITYKVLTSPFVLWGKFVNAVSVFISGSLQNSLFFHLAKMQLANAITGNSAFYGSLLMAFGLGGILFDFGFGIGFIIRLFLIAFGGLLLWLKTPVLFWLKGSFLFGFVESVLGADIEIDLLENMNGQNSILLGIINGFIMAAAGMFLPYYLTPAIFIAITGLLVLFWRFEVGVYLLAFIAPILPTMVCAGIALVSFFSFLFRSIIEKRPIIKWNTVSFFILGFMVVLAFFAVTSLAPAKSIQIFILYAIFISMYFVIINTLTNKKRLYWMVVVFLTSGLLVSLYGIYQQFFGVSAGNVWIDESMFEDISVRVYSTLENPNVLGEYLLFLIPLAMAMVWVSKGFLSKLYYTGIFGASALCLVFTQSRGCWIGIMIALFVYIFLVNKRYLSLFFIALLVAPFILPTSIVERFTSIGNVTDSSTSYRVFIWFGTLAMLRDFWPFGLGIGTEAFNKIYPFYSYNNIYAPHSHNIYLQLLVETGIVGIVVMLSMMFFFWRKLLNTFTRFGKTAETVFGVAVLAGSAAFMVQGAFDYVWYNYRVFLIFWMVLAIGMASYRMVKAGAHCD